MRPVRMPEKRAGQLDRWYENQRRSCREEDNPIGRKIVTAARQPPYYYPFKHGDAEITVVSDGPLPLGNPAANFVGASPTEIAAMLNRNFLPPDDLVLEQNAAVVKLGARTMLFETGMGTLKLFGETTGRLLESMKKPGSSLRKSMPSSARTRTSIMSVASATIAGIPTFRTPKSSSTKRNSSTGLTSRV
jgi:hypothetical protein